MWGRAIGSIAASLVGVLAAPLASAQTPEAAAAPPAPPLAETSPAPAVVTAPAVPYDVTTGEAEGRAQAQPRKYGVMLDVGVPDGIMAAFAYRPHKMARVHGGLGYNGISPGVRLGAVFLPLGWGPSLDLSYGHYFEGDANGLVSMIAGANEEQSALLSSVGYDYLTLRAGMEVGGDRFTFFFRGGISWVHTTLHNIDSLLEPEDGATTNGNITIEVPQDPTLNAFAPTLQLGFIVQL